jgi:hypothetical protein
MQALEALSAVPSPDIRPILLHHRLEALKARFLDSLEALDRALNDPAMERL